MSTVTISIGRSPNNSYVINDPAVSSQHAVIQSDLNGRYWIVDAGSKNGTFVNGKRIYQKTQLSTYDEIVMGNTKTRLETILHGNMPPTSDHVYNPPYGGHQPMDFPNSRKKRITMPLVLGGTLLVIGSLVGFVLFKNNGGGASTKSPQMEGKTGKPDIVYSLSCVKNGSPSDMAINIGSDLEDIALQNSGITISIEEEIKLGAETEKSLRSDHEFIESGDDYEKLVDIKNKLVAQIENPAGFEYNIYLIRENEVNAITAGAYIFVTTGMMEFCLNDHELACVIGHEIKHNELGHINAQLKKRKFSEGIMGKNDSWILESAMALIGMPFNQTNELDSDLHGVDLAIAAGYDGCAASKLWDRMAENRSSNEFAKWFSTHPFPETRKSCINDHIKKNYDYTCN